MTHHRHSIECMHTEHRINLTHTGTNTECGGGTTTTTQRSLGSLRAQRVCVCGRETATRLVRSALWVVVVACAFQPHFGAAPVSRNSTEFSVEYSDARNGCVPVIRVLFVRVRVLFVRPNCVRVLYARTCAHVCVCVHTLGAA